MQTHLDSYPIGELFFAPFDVLLSEFNVLLPDLVYVSNERAHNLTSKNLQGAPDLAVEILSHSTRARDLRLKRDVYERTGVLEYWVVDPEDDSFTVYSRQGESDSARLDMHGSAFSDPRRFARTDVLTTPLLPGFALPLERVFPPAR